MTKQYFNKIHTGDCFEELPTLDENSVHAVVTDPPYGLAFMGRSWDDFEPKEYQEWCEEWATECLRVLKPGGHLLAFSGNRTHHRLMSGIEDAGYEIRDTITWHYGSGFPKALDVSKAIDKQADAEGEYGDKKYKTASYDKKQEGYKRPWMDDPEAVDKQGREYNPATEQAEQWDGFRSALKPATEFVCVARSPLAEDTIAENVVAHGTGALNIDATRIETDGHDEGRYPSNVVFDEKQADVLDSNNETTISTGGVPDGDEVDGRVGDFQPSIRDSTGGVGDEGGVSRYFYTSKASKAERTLDGKIDNAHPTVKPIDLMEWLVTLATAEEQTVLDPFCGTGTTCRAAKDNDRQFIGIEQQAEWADVARVRTGLSADDHSHIRSDDSQHGLEQYQ